MHDNADTLRIKGNEGEGEEEKGGVTGEGEKEEVTGEETGREEREEEGREW